jgi:choline monooxygenase
MATTPIESYAIPAEQIEALSRPTLEAHTLPAEAYWDPAIFQREIERIFYTQWTCVGRVEDVPEAGDYMTVNIATEPLIVVRDGEGEIRAHLNVCRHRSCRLVREDGNTNAFRCPYHGWLFALNGELRGTPDFKETKGFDKADYSLFSAKVEIWEGFIMVNIDGRAGPFKDLVADANQWGCDKYRMGEMVTTHRWEYDLACNWKTYVENFIEEYHIPWVHPESFQLITPMKKWKEYPEITSNPWSIMIGQTPGLTFSDTGDALFPVSPGLDNLPPEYDGMPIWLVFPTLMVIPVVDALIYYVAFPDGPERTRIILRLALHKDAAAAWAARDPQAYEAGEQYANNATFFLDEDNYISQEQQIGLRSRLGTPGRFSKHEGLAREFDQWVADHAYRPQPAANGNGHANGHGNGR